MPPSNLTGAPPSLDHTSAVINLQTLPISNSNINELRSFYTALSDFISSYDELNTHISFINSSIDANLGLLVTSCDRTVNYVTEGVVSVQNPSASVVTRGYEETGACRKLEVDDVLNKNNSVETDAYNVSNNRLEIDVSENSYVEVDALEKPGAAGLSNNRLLIDASENSYVEVDALEKFEADDLSNNQLETVVSENNYEINALKKPEAADVSNNRLEVDVSENNYVETDAYKKIEVDDVLNNRLEIDVSENSYVEVDDLEKPEVADDLSNDHEEIVTCGRDIDVFKNRVEVDSLNSGFSHDYDELDGLKKPEVADESEEYPEEIEVCENHVDINSLKKPEVDDNDEEIDIGGRDIDVFKIRVESDSLNSGFSHGYDELDASKKPEASDLLNNHLELDVYDNLKMPEAADVLNNHEEIEVCENNVDIDSLEKIEVTDNDVEIDTRCRDVGVSDNHVDIDSLNGGFLHDYDELDASKKPEVADESKDHEAIVSEQNPNRIAANCKQSNENVRTSECVEIDVVVHKKPEQTDICKNPEETVVSKKAEQNGILKKAKETEALISELQFKCQNTSHKKLRRHVATHYSEMIDLREEIANALKLAKDPAKLVLNSIGRFFVPRSIGFRHCVNSHKKDESVTRMASVLILECFVMISGDGIEIAKQDREYAAKTAVDWRKRMIKEGGLGHTDEVDARGLLLLISGFGIQDDVFTTQDIMDLIRASNVKGISTALLHSAFLIPKIPEVISLMVKNNLETEAVDIAFTFGLEDVCRPRNMLTTNLHNTIKDIQNVSPLQIMKENAITPESLEEVDILNKPEETAALKKPEEIDILKQIEQTDICKDTDETAVLKKICPEEIDTSKTCEVIVALKKLEETVPETSCDQTIAIVSKEKSNGMSLRTPESLEEVDGLKKPAVIDTLMIPEENGTRKKTKERGPVSVLQFICQSMNSAELKWHIAEHISEMNNLRVVIANALKLAENPAKLVIYSIDRFYEQSSRTFYKDSDSKMDKQSAGRLASVLILECFVMISSDDGIEITSTVRKYAADAAVVWRNRIIKEGGLRHTDDVDARGLLLLISGFGIQDHVFSIQDIIDLIRASNVKGIATALRRSIFLMPKIREIIYKMVHNNLEIEAVDIAYTFRLEDTYNPGKILTVYLDNKIKDIQNAPPVHMLDAVKQHLLDLKSVKQCLESHNVPPSMLLPNFKINERIQYLEKEVNEWKLTQKRKPLEYPIHHEAKRACVSHQNMPHQHRPPVDHYNMNRFNWSPHPSTSYITAHSPSPAYNPYAMPGNTPGHYDQTVHTPYGWHHGPYGQHYPRHGQTYHSHPYHRPWEQGPLESSPGFMGRRLPSLDLYGFAEIVKSGSRGFPA